MTSIDTTSLGLKAIVARNATKLNEIASKEKHAIETSKKNKTSKSSKTKLEYHCNSFKYNRLYIHTLIPTQSSFMKLR
jgi:hypothetical protein